jgi:8-oxoguanine DNA glycosylase, N-terminal domain
MPSSSCRGAVDHESNLGLCATSASHQPHDRPQRASTAAMSLQFTSFQKLPLPIAQLSLAAVLRCGQSFRWSIFALPAQQDPTLPSHEYRLCLRDRVVCLRQSPETLFYHSLFPKPPSSPTQQVVRDAETLAWINDYFQLDVDLQELYEAWSDRDPIFRNIQGRFSGIRILRQDPWENLISFAFSSMISFRYPNSDAFGQVHMLFE